MTWQQQDLSADALQNVLDTCGVPAHRAKVLAKGLALADPTPIQMYESELYSPLNGTYAVQA